MNGISRQSKGTYLSMGQWFSSGGVTADVPDSKELSEIANNRVVIYVWTTQSLRGRRKSGHVAVEITFGNENGNGTESANTYISLWPKIILDPERWPETEARPTFSPGDTWALVNDYFSDRLLERRKPEYVFCFYSLEWTRIMHAFITFKSNKEKAYARFGDYVQKVATEQYDDDEELKAEKPCHQSCVSLACLTLDAGNINKWLNKKDKRWAASKGTSEVSGDQSADAFTNLQIIQPSTNVAYYVLEQLVSGYVMSPDVLQGRLKIAKRKEWEAMEKVRQLGRMTAVTRISRDGQEKSHQYSYQAITEPTTQREHNPPIEHPEVNETIHEWLPIDEKTFNPFQLLSIFLVLLSVFIFSVLSMPSNAEPY